MTIDEQIAVMQAYKEGETIEASIKDSSCFACIENPSWDFSAFDYRVKPEPEPPKYEPFSFEDDLVGKVVLYNKRKHLIVLQDQDRICISGIGWIDYGNHYFLNLMKNQDGTPFRKLVK